MPGTFVDTNVLLYAAGNDPSERDKIWTARGLVRSEELLLSTQVLQEFYWVATRPNKLGLSHEEAKAYLDVWKLFRIQPVNLHTVEDALHLCHAYRISYWDAAILAAARQLTCDRLYTEDLSDGQDYGGVRVVNPFLQNSV